MNPATIEAPPVPKPARAGVRESLKTTCETCGNSYDKAFQVAMNGETHVFDCFECAIQRLAPKCEHCGCRIIGHGVEESGRFFCGAHCAHSEGVSELTDRA